MKIVQIGSFPLNANLIKGGVESSVYGLSNSLAKTNKVYVVDFPRNSLSEDLLRKEDNIEIFHPKNYFSSNVGAVLKISGILKFIRKIDPDICHVHGSNYFSLLIVLLLRLKKYPVLLTIHGLLHIEQKNKFKNHKSIKSYLGYILKSLSEFLLISFSRTLIVDTQYVNNQIIEYRSRKKILRIPVIHIIPQGIHDKFFSIRRDIDQNNILSVGAFSRRKGHLFSLKAFNLLKNLHPDLNFQIAGINADTQYVNEIELYIDQNELKERVHLYFDINADHLIQLYNNADIFVLHSEEESQGIVFSEAMACGIPIVATNSGGIPDVIKHNQNGLLSTYGDILSFADNINSILTNKELRNFIADNNKLESEKYNWDKISRRILKIYENLIKN